MKKLSYKFSIAPFFTKINKIFQKILILLAFIEIFYYFPRKIILNKTNIEHILFVKEHHHFINIGGVLYVINLYLSNLF